MPIYLYRCQECSNTTEVMQKYGDPAPSACAHCGANALKKTIAPVGVIFKGSGFHKNDYTSTGSKSTKPASSSGDSKPAAESTATTDAGGGSETKSETKSESKSETSKSDKVA